MSVEGGGILQFRLLFPFLERRGWHMRRGFGNGFVYADGNGREFDSKVSVVKFVKEQENLITEYVQYISSDGFVYSCLSEDEDEMLKDGSSEDEFQAKRLPKDGVILSPKKRTNPIDISRYTVSYKYWCIWLDSAVRRLGGWENVEHSGVRHGSNAFTSNDILPKKNRILDLEIPKLQIRAQYGRANSHLVQSVIGFAKIVPEDRFIDIGSGIGQVVLQVASTVGCAAIGIELLSQRHAMAKRLHEEHKQFIERSNVISGQVRLICDDFTKVVYRQLIANATVLYINNACGTFGERCVEAGTATLNSHVAILARLTKLGTRIICFDRIYEMETEEMKQVFTAQPLKTLPNATNWSTQRINLTVYTKFAEYWRCKRCTYKNCLVDMYGAPVQQCEGCCEDPEGMQRSNYEFRQRLKPKT